jgi:hypothetical protein
MKSCKIFIIVNSARRKVLVDWYHFPLLILLNKLLGSFLSGFLGGFRYSNEEVEVVTRRSSLALNLYREHYLDNIS